MRIPANPFIATRCPSPEQYRAEALGWRQGGARGDAVAFTWHDVTARHESTELLRHPARHHALTRDDTVARFGGDEILVVLTGVAGIDEALSVAQRVRAAIAEPISDPESGAVVLSTASIGLTLTHPDDTVDALIARADRAMYEAKTSGRNRVVAHP